MDKTMNLVNLIANNTKGNILYKFTKIYKDYQIESVKLDCCESTQTLLNNVIDKITTKNHIYCIFSDTQINGKGRKLNKWYSPENNLYMSFSYITSKPELVNLMPIITSCAIYTVLSSATKSKDVKLKWINDIFINNSKVGGILCESSYINNTFYCSIGCGINLIEAPYLHNSVDYKSTNILSETKVKLKNDIIGPQILQYVIDYYEEFSNISFQGLKKLYEENLLWKNENVIVYDYENKILGKGRLIGINDVGHLIIKEENCKEANNFSFGTIRKNDNIEIY